MKITKHQPNDKGIIRIPDCIRLLTMGLQENIVTIWAVTDPVTKRGITMTFLVKHDGDPMTVGDCTHYINSFINDQGVWHLIGEEPKIHQNPNIMKPPLGGAPRSGLIV